MNTKSIRSWGVVNTVTGELEAVEFTREDARNIKRLFKLNGIDARIAKLTFNVWVR